MGISVKTLEIVAKIYGISVTDLKGGRQTKYAVKARQLAAYLLTELNYFYYPAVERIFGEDKITIINSYDKISRDMKISPKFRTSVEKILDYLQRVDISPKYEPMTSADILEAKKYILDTKRNIKITKREAYILSKYRKGLTFRKIASAIKISSERARQILLRVLDKEFFQKALNGFIADPNEYVKYELDSHNKLSRLLGNQEVERSLKKSVNTIKKRFLLRR